MSRSQYYRTNLGRDLAVPCCIWLSVGSLVYFLIELAGVYVYQRSLLPLKLTAGCYLLGVIMITRLREKGQKSQARYYQAALGLVTTLFILTASGQQGLFGFGGMSKPSGLAVTFGIFAALWWFAVKLTEECSVWEQHLASEPDSINPELRLRTLETPLFKFQFQHTRTNEFQARQGDPQDLTLLEKRASREGLRAHPSIPREKHPARLILYVAIPAVISFGLGGKALLLGNPAALRNGYVSMFVYVAATMLLLSFASLSELNVRIIKSQGEMMFRAKAWWTLVTIFTTTLIVFAVYALPHFERAEFGTITARQFEPAAVDPTVEESETQVDGGEGAQIPPLSTYPLALPPILNLLGLIGLVILVLGLIAFGVVFGAPLVRGLMTQRQHEQGGKDSGFRALKNAASNLLSGLLRSKPKDQSASTTLINPFLKDYQASGLEDYPLDRAISEAYQAFMQVLRATTKVDLATKTPLEIMRLLPPRFKTSAVESAVQDLTMLYIAVSYSPHELPSNCKDLLRNSWDVLHVIFAQ